MADKPRGEGEKIKTEKFFPGPRQECFNEFSPVGEITASMRWQNCCWWLEFLSGGVQKRGGYMCAHGKPGLGFGQALDLLRKTRHVQAQRPGSHPDPCAVPWLRWKGMQDGTWAAMQFHK